MAKSTKRKPKRQCLVCGDNAIGVRLGVLSCSACISFFRGILERGTVYHCVEKQSCTITKNHRRCQACRFRKCLALGMKPLKSPISKDKVLEEYLKNAPGDFLSSLDPYKTDTTTGNLGNCTNYDDTSKFEKDSENILTLENKIPSVNNSNYDDTNRLVRGSTDNLNSETKIPSGNCSTREDKSKFENGSSTDIPTSETRIPSGIRTNRDDTSKFENNSTDILNSCDSETKIPSSCTNYDDFLKKLNLLKSKFENGSTDILTSETRIPSGIRTNSDDTSKFENNNTDFLNSFDSETKIPSGNRTNFDDKSKFENGSIDIPTSEKRILSGNRTNFDDKSKFENGSTDILTSETRIPTGNRTNSDNTSKFENNSTDILNSCDSETKIPSSCTNYDDFLKKLNLYPCYETDTTTSRIENESTSIPDSLNYETEISSRNSPNWEDSFKQLNFDEFLDYVEPASTVEPSIFDQSELFPITYWNDSMLSVEDGELVSSSWGNTNNYPACITDANTFKGQGPLSTIYLFSSLDPSEAYRIDLYEKAWQDAIEMEETKSFVMSVGIFGNLCTT